MVGINMYKSILLMLLTSIGANSSSLCQLRIATWNVQEVGELNSSQYEATKDILLRINPDVISINEIWSANDVVSLENLATSTGYDHYYIAPPGPMGGMRSAVLSKFEFNDVNHISAKDLSNDDRANDITRFFVEAEINLPSVSKDLIVITNHWKATSGDVNEFRRSVESIRALQIMQDYNSTHDAVVIMGDINEEFDDLPLNPEHFYTLPGGLPQTYWLGDDLYDLMVTDGIYNDPFFHLQGFTNMLNSLQVDGKDVTHPGSGTRLDYVFISDNILEGIQSEVYDSSDEWMGAGLQKYGNALASGTSGTASDHLLIFADIIVRSPFVPIPKVEYYR